MLCIRQERKRVAVLEEQQRRLQEAMAAKSATQAEDNMEMKAMKAMGAMEEGDAVFGSGAEVNLESQVYNDYQYTFISYLLCTHVTQLLIACRYTGGMISIVQESPSISTVFTLDTNGTNTTKHITIMTILPRRLYKATSSIYFTQILLIKRRLLFTPLKRMEATVKLV